MTYLSKWRGKLSQIPATFKPLFVFSIPAAAFSAAPTLITATPSIGKWIYWAMLS